MRTQEVETLLGITKQTIIFYEKEGLLTPLRDTNGYRNYGEADIQTLKLVKLFRAMNISIDDIKLVLKKELSFQECLQVNENKLETVMEELQEIQQTVSYLKEKNLPMIPALMDVDVTPSPFVFGYQKTNKTASLGRRITKTFALWKFLNGIIMSAILTLCLVAGMKIWSPLTLNYFLVGLIWIVAFTILLLSGFQIRWLVIEVSKNQYIEFLEDNVCYYRYRNPFNEVRYLWSALFNQEEKYLTKCSYEDITVIKIKKSERYVNIPGTNLPIEVTNYDFWFTFKSGETLYLYNPIRIDDDSYLVASILKNKVPTIIDLDGFLDELLSQKTGDQK